MVDNEMTCNILSLVAIKVDSQGFLQIGKFAIAKDDNKLERQASFYAYSSSSIIKL